LTADVEAAVHEDRTRNRLMRHLNSCGDCRWQTIAADKAPRDGRYLLHRQDDNLRFTTDFRVPAGQ
jgi:hypothetical protein